MMDALHRVREEFSTALAEGRALGEAIGRDPKRTKELTKLSCIERINRLGLNIEDSLVERIVIYETLAHIDINLAVGVPGPVMTGFACHALASPAQMEAFQIAFTTKPQWTCFALTESHAGTDASAIGTVAQRTPHGWLINGQKYMVGQGVTADIAIIFARTSPGPFGLEAFWLRPEDHSGYSANRLVLTGCRGTNLSEIKLTNIELPESARLGAHMRPSARTACLISSTFNAMRPCVGAMALGLTRAVLDRAEATGLIAAEWNHVYRLRTDGLMNWAMEIGAAHEAGEARPNAAGMMKTQAVAVARDIITSVLLRCPASELIDHYWLTRAWCDIGGLEYAEGVSNIHRLNAAQAMKEVVYA